jgi:hypothetical protein
MPFYNRNIMLITNELRTYCCLAVDRMCGRYLALPPAAGKSSCAGQPCPARASGSGSPAADLVAEDWRKLLETGQESLGQALGRAVAAVNGSGLLARSAAVPRGINVAVFPGACAHDHLEIVEGEKLAKLGVRTRT